MVTYSIESEFGYYVVYVNNKFYCTCDTMGEAIKEVDDLIKNREVINQTEIN